MKDRLRFLFRQARETLWIRPLIACVLSIGAALLAKAADTTGLEDSLPDVSMESLKTLLSVMASSMLVIATFSVSSMIAAYSAASSSATPRAFSLIVADDVSQNALSSFIGSFIFSIVALIALLNEFYGSAGRFVLFVVTLLVFTIVIATFVRWVDRIARLGRMESTIEKVELATVDALVRRRDSPRMGGVPVTPRNSDARRIYTTRIGYVQQIDLTVLQSCAEEQDCRVEIVALPGAFITPRRAIAYIKKANGGASLASDDFEACFRIGKKRTFEDDPEFGLTVLSEIASRALSPGVNDPGTAINVIGAFLRAFCIFIDPRVEESDRVRFDRIEVPELELSNFYDAAFSGIERDGADTVAVMVRLLEAYESLLPLCGAEAAGVTQEYARLAAERAINSISFPADRERLSEVAARVARWTV